MEHKPFVELQALAQVKSIEAATTMTPEQRLKRWIELLEGEPERKLRSLHEIEYLSRPERRQCRADNSPLTVAYEDPILLAAGLKSDRVGDCTDFFQLSDRQMHHAFCSCHVGLSLTGMQAAQRLRQIMRRDHLRSTVKRAISQVIHAVLPARLTA